MEMATADTAREDIEINPDIYKAIFKPFPCIGLGELYTNGACKDCQ